MKLSEAIRAGAKIRPQAHGAFYKERRRWFGILGPSVRQASCALGAAIEVVGYKSHMAPQSQGMPFRGEPAGPDTPVEVMDLPVDWLPILHAPTACPQCEKTDEVYRLIPHLNDDHKWKREEIALWVAKVEHEVEWLQADSMPTGAETSIPEAKEPESNAVR